MPSDENTSNRSKKDGSPHAMRYASPPPTSTDDPVKEMLSIKIEQIENPAGAANIPD